MKRNIEILDRLSALGFEGLFSLLILNAFSVICLRRETEPQTYLALFLMYVFSYVIRELAANNAVNFLLHAVITAMVATVSYGLSIRIIIVGFGLYMFRASVVYGYMKGRMKREHELPWHVFLACFIFYLFGQYMKNEELMKHSFIIAIVLAFLYMLTIYLNGIKSYMDSAKDVSGLPISDIVMRNSIIVSVIAVIMLAGTLLLSRVIDLSEPLDAIKNFIFNIIGTVVTFIMYIANLLTTLFTRKGQGQSEATKQYEMPKTEYMENNSPVYYIVFVVVFGTIAVICIFKLCKALICFMFKRRILENDIVEVAGSCRENCEEKRKRRGLRERFSYEERARKYYRVRVLRHRYDLRLTKYITCDEITEDVRNTTGEELDEITTLYKRVRYDSSHVDRATLKKMNRLSRM